jgi:hypothetical protein
MPQEIFGQSVVEVTREDEQSGTDLMLLRSSDPDKQTTTSNGGDDLASRISTHDEPDVRRVFLHSPTEGGLGVSAEGVGFVDDDHWIRVERREGMVSVRLDYRD